MSARRLRAIADDVVVCRVCPRLVAWRERVAVEHSLAHIGHWQGDRARYCGERKNLFDVRRAAVVHNLHIIARAPGLAHAA